MLRDQLGELLGPVVAGLGYELWEIEYVGRAGGGVLRLYIDRGVDSGIGPGADTGGEEGPQAVSRMAPQLSPGMAPGMVSAITLDDCERVSRAVSEVLDEADPIPGHYTLEVSSPGLDRVLRTRAHFERFAGERVRLEMIQPVDGRKRFSGRLTQVGRNEITLETDGGTVSLPIDDIHRARLAPQT